MVNWRFLKRRGEFWSLTVILAVIAAVIAIGISIFLSAFSSHSPSGYEPKDLPRGTLIERGSGDK